MKIKNFFSKMMFDKIINHFLSPEHSMSLVLFNIISISGFVAGLISLIISLVSSPLAFQNFVIIFLELAVAFSVYLVNKKKMLKFASIFIVSLVSFVLFPLIFFLGGGAYSGMSSWFSLCIIFSFLILNGWYSVIMIFLQIGAIIFCYVVAFYHPELVVPLKNERTTFIDIAQSGLLVGIAIGVINKFQRIIYNKVITKIEGQKKILKESEEKADAANQAKSDFLSNMSHEIRTPINAILGMNEMILRECHDKKILEYANAVQNSSQSLLSLINDVLDISKIESGKIEILAIDYKLSNLVCDCFSLVSPRFEKKGLKTSMFCEPTLPAGLRGDEVHIRQIVVNFLTNAAKYTEKGKVNFIVTGKVTNEKATISFSVKDTGIGIKDEDKDKMFGKFERFDMKRNRNIEGTGLGLSLSKKLAELMGGTIEVKSVYGVGSEFILTIPQGVWDENSVGEVNITKRNSKEVKIYHQSFEAPEAKILAVDDVYMNLIVFENLLKETKMKIDLAESGADALKKASRKKYDLIFMDHMMPEMNGIQTLEKLRTIKDSPNYDTPVIMLTANALAGVRNEYIDKGFKDYISKPLNGDALEEILVKYLPQQKIIMHNQVTEINEVRLAKLKKILPEFEYDVALSYCDGSEELCMTIIADWCSEDYVDSLKLFFTSEAWENYRQYLHALKNSTRTIGLPSLAEKFRLLEGAIKVGDIAYARKHNDEVLNDYANCLSKIKEAGLYRNQ